MKIRNDFVSNSSSSSFIVQKPNLQKFFETFKSTFDRDDLVSYDMEPEVFIYTKNKNHVEVEEAITGDKSTFSMKYNDYKTGELKDKDPEDIGFNNISTTLNKLTEVICEKDIDWDKVEKLEFSCDDYETDKMQLLKMFYMFLKEKGCRPDASESERDFMNGTYCSFIDKLVKNTSRQNQK